jgi:hypothetical protein
MNWKSYVSLSLTIGMITMFALPDAAIACSCREAPPACQEIGESELIFVGTVIDRVSEDSRTRFRMKVDRAYKGTLKPEVDLYAEDCSSPNFKLGRQ